jgi:hypothetical protein
METIGIIFLTGFLGYQIANSKNETIRNVSEKDNGPEDMPEREKPNSLNIYNSNKVNEINDVMLQMSMDKYADAKNPSVTGVLPPIYNSYSVVGNNNLNLNEILAKDPSLQTMSDINSINRYQDPIKKPEPELNSRPMFQSAYDNELPQDFTNFGQGAKQMNQDISLLTGKILDKQHVNMVPFFGSNVTQNVEQFANVATLDNFTGNTDTFFHKKEQAQRFNNVKQDIYGTPALTANIQLERYIPSLYKQGEKPFNEVRVNAPIANTGHNPINAAAADFKTIDQMRTTNNPQISYEGVMKSGQLGSVRGVSGVVNKNRVDTHFELGQDRLFTDTGYKKEQSQVNFTNMQNTTRQSQNLEYYGSAVSKESLKTEPRYSSVDNSSELSVLFQEPIRQQLDNDFTRNVNRSNMANNSDYGKGSYNLPELERDSTSTMHTINLNKQGTKSQVGVLDDIKGTMKETTLIQDNSGNITFIKKSDNTNGLTNYDFRTTQKEIDIDKTYIGQPMKKDQTGYNVSKYSAKTTNKETTSDLQYQGGAGANDGKSNSMVYSTYDNPEKVRNAVHPKNYKGNATTQGFTQNENRQRYANAEVNLNQEKLISNERPSGPQAFNISGGVNTVGDLNYRPNTLLKGEENRHLQNKDNISSNIPTQKLLGNRTQTDNNQFSEQVNTRETNDFKNLIVNQLADNPFYNLR